MDNYIMLNGKKIELTPDQVKLIQADEPKTLFDRVKQGDNYDCMGLKYNVGSASDYYYEIYRELFNTGNYCANKNIKNIIEQHSLHMLLNNLLWRYSMNHGGEGIEFGPFSAQKYHIAYDSSNKEFYIDWNDDVKNVGIIYFESNKTAEAAIKEIVMPFTEEHPDFDIVKM